MSNAFKFFVKTLKIIICQLAYLFFLIILIISIISYSEITGFSIDHSIIMAVGYIPSMWLIIPAFFASGIFYFTKKLKLMLLLLFVFIPYLIIDGDYSLGKNYGGNPVAFNSSKEITVITSNVRYYSKGVQNVAEFLSKIDADIVLLNENVLHDNEKAGFEFLLECYEIIHGRNGESAILSKLPVLSYKEIELPTHQASLSGSNDIEKLHLNPKRSFLYAKVKLDSIIINVISARLIAGRPKNNSLKEQIKWGNYLAMQQKIESDFLVKFLNKLEGPVIFGGDFNASPNSKVIKNIRRIAQDTALEVGGIPGATFRTNFPIMRLDYIFTMNGIYTREYKRLNAEISDHLPVYAKLAL